MIFSHEYNSPEEIIIRIIKKNAKKRKLKEKICECVKNNQFEEAKKFADELEKTEKTPVIVITPYIIC